MKARHLIGLQAATDAGVIGEAQWREWADRSMFAEPQVPAWLFELSITTEPMAAVAALSDGVAQTEVFPADPDRTSAHLGFLRLRHEAGDIELLELLERAGRLTDATNYDNPSCEAFYLLLNEIDSGGPIKPNPRPLVERADELFNRHLQGAQILLDELAVQPAVAVGRGPRLRSEPRR